MRIVILSDFFVPHQQGGGERRYYEIGKRLVERGHEVLVLSMRFPGVLDEEDVDGIIVKHIGPLIKNPPFRSALDFLHYIFSSSWWLLRNDFDVIDANTYLPLIPGFIASRLRRKGCISTIHDTYKYSWDEWFYNSRLSYFFEKFLVKLPHKRIVTVSRKTRKSLIHEYGVDGKRITIVPDGVDLEKIDSVEVSDDEVDDKTVIHVGRLIPHKHVEDLLNALNCLSDKDIKVKVVGTGFLEDKLRDLASDLGVGDRVVFTGFLPDYSDVIREIKKSSVLVLCSTQEGFGMVLAEANACSKPVLTYNSGGVLEVVVPGKNGLIVRLRDVRQMAEAINYLLTNKQAAEEMGTYGRGRIEEKFSWDSITDKMEVLYGEARK